MPRTLRTSGHYGLILVLLALTWFMSSHFGTAFVSRVAETPHEGEVLLVLFDIIMVFLVGFLVSELAKPTIIPSFVLAIAFGMAARHMLLPLIEHTHVLSTLATVGALLILFGGGIETPFSRFKELLWPSVSLAIVGSLLQAFLTSVFLLPLSAAMGVAITLPGAILLGAALTSTDPASIIPSLRSLLFLNPRPKHIGIIESAITDVTGIVLTGVFLALLQSGVAVDSILTAYAMLLKPENVVTVLRVLVVGTAVGIAGFGILHVWSAWKEKHGNTGESDPAMFLAVPFGAYGFAVLLGGSGYLAAFLAGLLFQIRSHFQHVEHYFNHTIEGFLKPMIFMLLGALVDPALLLDSAPIGIATFVVFILLRPVVVVATLFPFLFTKDKMTFKEFAFLSMIRETGVIPAVLLMGIAVSPFEDATTIAAVGLWVILLSLVILPPLTPFVAKALGIARSAPPFPHRPSKGAVAVLCSRGYSFLERMEAVVRWASQHHVDRVVLLHCPEGKYSEALLAEVEKLAQIRFGAVNARLVTEGRKELTFEFLGRPGLLQENIEVLVEKEEQVSIIFVGNKMLDYRLGEIKRLPAPFIFLP